nr:PREDICTED: GTPase IMAP family member 4-like [Lepisosteus oculatus]
MAECELRRRLQAARDEQDAGEIRLILLGLTGMGKSASANTILGCNVFQSKAGASTITQQCRKKTRLVLGRKLTVIDTPGLFDPNSDEKEVKTEIGKSVCYSTPGPHVFLLVLTVGRYTQENKKTVKEISNLFGSVATKYTMVLFTRIDDLEGQTLENFIVQDSVFTSLVEQFGNRFHGFNNRDRSNDTQVEQFLEKVEVLMRSNSGHFYTNEMYEVAGKAVQQKMEEILTERMAQIQAEEEKLKKAHRSDPTAMREAVEELWVKEVKKARKKAEEDNSFITRLKSYGKRILSFLRDLLSQCFNGSYERVNEND